MSGSLDEALSFIEKDPSIHRVFVIGGSTIYQVGVVWYGLVWCSVVWCGVV